MLTTVEKVLFVLLALGAAAAALREADRIRRIIGRGWGRPSLDRLPEPAVSATGGESRPGSLAGSLDEREREVILAALRAGKNRSAAAQTLGISARTLRYKLARLREAGITVPSS